MSSVFCKKIKNFLENFQKTLQKCKSKYECVGSFVKKCLKIAVLQSCHGVSASPLGGIDPSFWAQNGAGVSFQHLERNKDKISFSERTRKFIFLLGAKGSENDKGGIFRVAPFVNPKTPHTPTNEKQARREQPPPCLRGQTGNVKKRIYEMGTSAHQKTRRR